MEWLVEEGPVPKWERLDSRSMSSKMERLAAEAPSPMWERLCSRCVSPKMVKLAAEGPIPSSGLVFLSAWRALLGRFLVVREGGLGMIFLQQKWGENGWFMEWKRVLKVG
ncbi:hypothetical protein Fot_43425 [Forsythia ovata]|uniref:Uncharacterized protein n=1 Tax=Forsythia ovata TaxID=205694 RepID=A0ABD1RQW5_9LAMI